MKKQNKNSLIHKKLKERPFVFYADKQFNPEPVLTEEMLKKCVDTSNSLRKSSKAPTNTPGKENSI